MRQAPALQLAPIDRPALVRGVIAGTVWGFTLSAGFIGLSLYRCGGISLVGIVETTSLSLLTGPAVIGPIAALRKRAGPLIWR